MFWFAQDSSNKVEFIYKTLISISQNDKFSDILEKIKYEKIKLFRYFTEEIRIYTKNMDAYKYKVEDYAAGL